MIIQSKATGVTHEIDIETWEKMKANDIGRRFKVISTLEYEPAKAVPVEVKDFMSEKVEVKKVYEKEDIKEDVEEETPEDVTPEKPKKPRKKKVEPKSDSDE